MTAETQYDADRGIWLVPLSDANLDLLSQEWSRPVQIRAQTNLQGEWEIVVREVVAQ